MKAGSNLARRLADLALLQRKGTAIVALRNLAAQHAENQASIAKASIIFKNLLLQRGMHAVDICPQAGAIVPLVKLLEDGMRALRV